MIRNICFVRLVWILNKPDLTELISLPTFIVSYDLVGAIWVLQTYSYLADFSNFGLANIFLPMIKILGLTDGVSKH